MVDSTRGSALWDWFTNVVGLPLCETARLATAADIIVSSIWPGRRLPEGATLSTYRLTRGVSGRQNRRLASHVVVAAIEFRRHRQPHPVEQALFHQPILGR